MGHKKLKEHYRIGHIVCVTDKGICIGSPYIHDLIIIGFDGAIIKAYERLNVNEDLKRYVTEMRADTDKLREVVQAPDTFDAAILVYTYEGGSIIEKLCEKPGWPNVTHDGDLMYENTYSQDKDEVVRWAKSNARSGIEWEQKRVEEIKADLTEMEGMVKKSQSDLAKLETDYPSI